MQKQHPKLRGFAQHGVVFTIEPTDDGHNAGGRCPFCGGEGKFWVNVENGLWDCKVCATSGNFEKFMRLIARKNCKKDAKCRQALMKLAKDRGLPLAAFSDWQVGWNGREFTIPACGNVRGLTSDIRRYQIGNKPMSTAGGKSSLIIPRKHYGSKRVWAVEGEWDGMAWWEMLKAIGMEEDVYALAGVGNFPKGCVDLFLDKDVVILFDNDEPAVRGTERTWRMIEPQATSVKRLEWPDGLNDGYDLRDLYRKFAGKPKKMFDWVLDRVTDAPLTRDVSDGNITDSRQVPGKDVLDGKGMKPATVLREYKKWMYIWDPMILDVMFGSIFANRIEADPLWMFFVSPPGGSKSEYLRTLFAAPKILAVTSITPHALISGANFAGSGDPSLIPKAIGKTMVVKDFTAILSMNSIARDEIFGILRDAYDGQIEKRFGNGVVRSYVGTFGIVAGVTPAIESYSNMSSVLGERFIRIRIGTKGKVGAGEEEIKQSIANLTSEGEMRKGLTEVATKVLKRPITRAEYPHIPQEFATKVMHLSQWIARLRGVVNRERYTQQVVSKPTAEVGTRLAKQLCVLALGIGIYHFETELTDRTYQIIARVARDTIPNRTEEVIKQMYIRGGVEGGEYITTSQIGEWARFPTDTTRPVLQDLDMLHIVRKKPGVHGHWALSDAMLRLMNGLGLYDQETEWAKAHKNRSRKR